MRIARLRGGDVRDAASRPVEALDGADVVQDVVGDPLGARALYIHQNGEDTLYRLHGSPEWWTMGTAASSGCVRLVNQDVIDLYERVPHHAPIVVKQTQLTA